MIDKKDPKLDPITAAKLRKAMREEAAQRKAMSTPYVRVRRPWLGALNWERHKRKLAAKRRQNNKMARLARKAQRRT